MRSTEKSHVLMCIIRPCLEQLYAKSYSWKRCTRSTVKPSRFFSVYICQPSIAGMPKFRLLAHSDSMLSHTREADEEFKKNS